MGFGQIVIKLWSGQLHRGDCSAALSSLLQSDIVHDPYIVFINAYKAALAAFFVRIYKREVCADMIFDIR